MSANINQLHGLYVRLTSIVYIAEIHKGYFNLTSIVLDDSLEKSKRLRSGDNVGHATGTHFRMYVYTHFFE